MSAAPHLTLHHTHHRDVTLIRAAGELDMTTGPLLLTRSRQLLADGHHRLILDLEDVFFCDSSGLGTLISIWRLATADGGSLILSALPARLNRLLKVTGTHTFLNAYPTADDALNAQRPPL